MKAAVEGDDRELAIVRKVSGLFSQKFKFAESKTTFGIVVEFRTMP